MVIYGIGGAGALVVQSLHSSCLLAGFLDRDNLYRREAAALRANPPSRLDVLIRDHGVKHVILSIPYFPPLRRSVFVASMSGQA